MPLTESVNLVLKNQSVAPPLIDKFSGAAAAYSLRSLTAGNIPVVRVRRSSDNSEQDFTAEQVTNGTLTTFCGAGNGFVRTWYDQSGNGRHAAQTTTADQPQIVSSGSLITALSKPSISFDGSTDLLQVDNLASIYSSSNPTVVAASVATPTLASRSSIFGAGNTIIPDPLFVFSYETSGAIQFQIRDSSATIKTRPTVSSAATANTTDLLFLNNISGQCSIWRNSINLLSNADTSVGSLTLNTFTVGGLIYQLGRNSLFAGKIQELILFSAGQAASRAAIESNINAHYAIY